MSQVNLIADTFHADFEAQLPSIEQIEHLLTGFNDKDVCHEPI